jgi:adenosylcobinamide-GDP ribazoletransferase
MPAPLRLLLVAVAFLTRLPVGGDRPPGPGELRRSSALFPLVGLGLAGLAVAVRAAAEPLWGTAAATVMALAALVAATGALHEDGLADSADGLWGGWDPAGRLAIMRDSRIGTYGIVALVTVLALRASLLIPLDLAGFARAAACAEVCSRAALLLVARVLPPAAEGSGAEIAGPLPRGGAVAAGVVTAGTLVAAAGFWSPAVLLAGLLACLACVRLFRRRLGGFTGDTLGATQQVVAVTVVAAVAALVRAGWL